MKKYETVCTELAKKVIVLYARGMSADDIKSEIDELYGVDISPSMISIITDTGYTISVFSHSLKSKNSYWDIPSMNFQIK